VTRNNGLLVSCLMLQSKCMITPCPHFFFPALPPSCRPLFSCTMSQLSLAAMVTHTCIGKQR